MNGQNEMFIQDVMRFLDNVLEDFIKNAPESMKNAVYSAKKEKISWFRSDGIS